MQPLPKPVGGAVMEQVAAAMGQARALGTCGELVQGQFHDGTDFLVTLPVDLWSTVRVEIIPEPTVSVHPAVKTKTQQAARLVLNKLGYPGYGARVSVTSDLPVGKGMASSTADIVATCRATAVALGCAISPEMISHVARQIEPSDGVMYPGVVCYNHRQCRLIDHLGILPPLEILVADLGGVVNTLSFNTLPKNYTGAELEAIQIAYELVSQGIRAGDMGLVGQATTISARINQRLLPKPRLDDFIRIAETHGAYGINVAHSGTVVGLLFEPGERRAIQRARASILESLHPTPQLWTVRSR